MIHVLSQWISNYIPLQEQIPRLCRFESIDSGFQLEQKKKSLQFTLLVLIMNFHDVKQLKSLLTPEALRDS